MENHDNEENIYQTIANKIYELHNKIGQSNEFDKALRELRILYKQYPSYFSQDDINNINSYKESNNAFYGSNKTTNCYNTNKTASEVNFNYIIEPDGTITRI